MLALGRARFSHVLDLFSLTGHWAIKLIHVLSYGTVEFLDDQHKPVAMCPGKWFTK